MLSKIEPTFYYKKESPYLMVDITPSDEELREKERMEHHRTSLQLKKIKESNKVRKMPR